LSNEQPIIAISEEEKALLVQEIIRTVRILMEKTISRKSPKNRARDSSKPHKQSKTHIAGDTILFNTLTNTQRLPARPRDFRINFCEEEKNIQYSELSDILSSMVSKHILENKREKFSYPKGRPLSDIKKSGIAEERRGPNSYYELSRVKELINEILKESIQVIDNAILKSPIFYSFLKYGFKVGFYQMKENEKAFMNTMKPAIKKYGFIHKSKPDTSEILARDLTPDKIERLAKGYAINTMSNFKEDGKNILYSISGVFSLFNVYGSEKEEKEPMA
jgi:hypothetical protein